MRAVLCSSNKIQKLNLPSVIEGSFSMFNDTSDTDIISITSENGSWVVTPNSSVKLSLNGTYVEKSILAKNSFYVVSHNNKGYILFVEDTYDTSFNAYIVKDNTTITIGNTNTDITYSNSFIHPNHASINYVNGSFKLVILENNLVYVNDGVVKERQLSLFNGDVISLFGLRIVICNNILIINNPNNNVIVNKLENANYYVSRYQGNVESISTDLYTDEDYFFKRPRIRRYIVTTDFKVASPPAKHVEEDTPLLLVIGPMATMGIIAIVRVVNIVAKIVNGTTTLSSSWSTLLTSGAMLLTMLLWPTLTKRYQKAKAKKLEETRVKKYRAYISKKQEEVKSICNEQKAILEEQLLPVDKCQNIIDTKSTSLWDRQNSQKDFLSVRIGRGDIPLDINITFSEEEFTLEEDELKDEAEALVKKAANIEDAPIEYSFKNKATAIMGDKNKIIPFTKNVLFQLATYHSYDDLKIVFLIDEENKHQWAEFKNLPHLFSNDKQIRFFATNLDEMRTIDSYLSNEYIKRANNESSKELVETEEGEINYKPVYLIVTDNYSLVRKLNIDNLVLENKMDLGFHFIIAENKFGVLPSQCLDFISLGKEESETLKNNSEEYITQKFKDEINDMIDYNKYSQRLANIPIEIEGEAGRIPESLSFLEMFRIGKVEQLNSLTRWKRNDPTQSLRALVGVMADNNRVYLDLHEKAHGPHGLIAGTTGSGKSEFIITYILSMALNYSPEEVSFILIDYKGGGLAGAFENKLLNIRLPHLSGVITNLDKAELNRTLVSINSELQRRQAEFNKARDELGESTIDIYKYQKFYREGKLKKPISHLFIICDEFAELKSQQPEFMNDLISAARIGRSLGVHLILATQKPSGVVNDQIWSNTKFRVCLKVQDRGDSNEMLKKPDAAEIKNAGRFYLQVGYDDIYLLGQSGYAGVAYKPSEFIQKNEDKSIVFIDDIGESVKEVTEEKKVETTADLGDQLSNVLKYIINMAARTGLKADRLWLDNIPKDIYVDELIKKYNWDASKRLEAIVGEYDDPTNQRQNILTLPLNSEANTLIFGRDPIGREMFLNSVIYSLCTRYRTEAINMYILDFGSETFKIYSRFPQVGDVMTSSDTEKVTKTFTIINELIVSRKNLFADYNGDYFNYCKNSGKTVPMLLFIINNYESFVENYQKYDEDLVRYSREGKRYGILIMITAASTHGFPFRVRRNFNNFFALELPDRTDYVDLFGKIGNLYPSDLPGRGICKTELPCEFQTSSIYNGDDITSYLKQVAENVSKTCEVKAPNIPVLPDKVVMSNLLPDFESITSTPIGLERSTLKNALYNFKRNKLTLIVSVELENTLSFVTSLIKMFVSKENIKVVLIDLEKVMTKVIDDVTGYCDASFNKNASGIMGYIDKNIVQKQNNLMFIVVGVEKILNSNNAPELKKVIEKISTLDNANAIMVDSTYNLKKLAMQSWYLNVVKTDDGIFIGSGLNEQAVIKANTDRKTAVKINNSFGWQVRNGSASLVKLMEMDDDEQ